MPLVFHPDDMVEVGGTVSGSGYMSTLPEWDYQKQKPVKPKCKRGNPIGFVTDYKPYREKGRKDG
jgi:hypothetical protein